MSTQSPPNPSIIADEILPLIPYFSALRGDERMQVARALNLTVLEAGATLSMTPETPFLAIVVAGRLTVSREGHEAAVLLPGDSSGEIEVVTGQGKSGILTAREPSTVATINAAGFSGLLEKYPIISRPLVDEFGHDLAWRNEMLREICIARAEGLPPAQLAAMLERRRRRLRRRRHGSLRRIGAALVRVAITEPARRPVFWMFIGASLALVSARTVVAGILKKGLQKHLFALIGSATGNPIHIHHFNYGLLIVALTGLLSLFPRIRTSLRTLSLLFGFGVGLVVDEFALLWNLNPDYYQPSSRLAAAVVLMLLAQLVWFSSMYAALARRVFSRIFS